MQLVSVQLHAPGVQVKGRHFKSPFLQPSVENGKAALLINQHFQMGPGLINEDKRISLRNLSPQFIKDDAAKQIEPSRAYPSLCGTDDTRGDRPA